MGSRNDSVLPEPVPVATTVASRPHLADRLLLVLVQRSIQGERVALQTGKTSVEDACVDQLTHARSGPARRRRLKVRALLEHWCLVDGSA